jgi:hypothetical protein
LFCREIRGKISVYHSHEEQHGDKHICKMGLHRAHKCGCECWSENAKSEDESYWENILTPKAQSLLMKSHQIELLKHGELDPTHHLGVHVLQQSDKKADDVILEDWSNWADKLSQSARKWGVTPSPTPSWYNVLPNAAAAHTGITTELPSPNPPKSSPLPPKSSPIGVVPNPNSGWLLDEEAP